MFTRIGSYLYRTFTPRPMPNFIWIVAAAQHTKKVHCGNAILLDRAKQLFVTNEHVVEDASDILLLSPLGKHRGEVIAKTKKADLAIIRAADMRITRLETPKIGRVPNVGTRLIVQGYILSGFLSHVCRHPVYFSCVYNANLTKDVLFHDIDREYLLNRIEKEVAPLPFIERHVPQIFNIGCFEVTTRGIRSFIPGLSGSPVLTEEGKLVGIATRAIKKTLMVTPATKILENFSITEAA